VYSAETGPVSRAEARRQQVVDQAIQIPSIHDTCFALPHLEGRCRARHYEFQERFSQNEEDWKIPAGMRLSPAMYTTFTSIASGVGGSVMVILAKWQLSSLAHVVYLYGSKPILSVTDMRHATASPSLDFRDRPCQAGHSFHRSTMAYFIEPFLH